MKILVVDDKPENIAAAKIAFRSFGLFNIAYASSAKEAMEKIMKTYEADSVFFDIVISDLEMEEKTSGLQVIAKASEYLALPFIATGQEKGGHSHGPSTRVEPMGKVINGRKDDSRVWEMIIQEVRSVLDKAPYQQSLESLRNYRRFVGKPSSMIAEVLTSVFSILC